jgi:hypothetical protein
MMAMVAGCLVAAGPWAPPARAQQPTGFTHAWGTSSGTIFNDEGRGVAVRHDGSVIWTGTILDPSPGVDDQAIPMTLVKKYGASGAECWSVAFSVTTPMSDSVAARGLALADPSIEPASDGIAYVVGRFAGSVSFGGTNLSASRDSGYVAKISEPGASCPGGNASVAWVRVFAAQGAQPENRSVAAAVATGRKQQGVAGCQDATGSTSVFGTVVAVGFFNGPTQFETVRTSTDDDGFVALLSPATGQIMQSFVIGGPGNQRITAVAIDERTQDVFVAGWYDNEATDFDPGEGSGNTLTSINYQDGRDLFVARYRVAGPDAQLLWVHTWGTAASPGADFFDDEATCIALGVNDDAPLSTLAFVGGWRSDAPGVEPGAGKGNPIFLAVGEPITSNRTATVRWRYLPSGQGDDRVLAVAADGLGRPVFTGQFGCRSIEGTACQGGLYGLEFNPSANPTVRFEANNLDVFVVRYHPTIQESGTPPTPRWEWTYDLGASFDEAGTAIAFDPAYTSRFALTGYFGKPDAMPGSYTINLDPGAGTSSVTSAGFSDSFLSVLDPSAPQALGQNVGFQISLVLDNSISMYCPGDQFSPMLRCLRAGLQDAGVIPSVGSSRPGGGTRQKAVQVNAIVHTTDAVLGRNVRVVMPWTVFDDTTRPLFARRLGAIPLYHWGSGSTNQVGDGFLAARDSLARSGVGSDAYASILLVGNEQGDSTTPAARDAASAPGFFDRICSAGAGLAQRNAMLLQVITPRVPGAQTAEDIDRGSVGIASHWPSIEAPSSVFNDILYRMLQRLSWCPSDFNRDECTDRNGNAATDDRLIWNDATGSYRDWNFDLGPITDDDWRKLEAGFVPLPPVPNRFLCNSCPQN